MSQVASSDHTLPGLRNARSGSGERKRNVFECIAVPLQSCLSRNDHTAQVPPSGHEAYLGDVDQPKKKMHTSTSRAQLDYVDGEPGTTRRAG